MQNDSALMLWADFRNIITQLKRSLDHIKVTIYLSIYSKYIQQFNCNTVGTCVKLSYDSYDSAVASPPKP